MSQLKFNNFVIADEAEGDFFDRISTQRPEIRFTIQSVAGAAGGVPIQLGNQDSDDTRKIIRYGNADRGSFILYFETEAAAYTYLDEVDEFRTNIDNLLGTITDKIGTVTGMIWSNFSHSEPVFMCTPHLSHTSSFVMNCEAEFIQYDPTL